MKKWISDNWGIFIFPAMVVFFILIIWLGIRFDLGEDGLDQDGKPTLDIGQEFGGR